MFIKTQFIDIRIQLLKTLKNYLGLSLINLQKKLH